MISKRYKPSARVSSSKWNKKIMKNITVLSLKSSLIQSILRELPLSEGRISVRGVVSYASQEPWLFTGSVRQNILFNSPMDTDRYDQVNVFETDRWFFHFIYLLNFFFRALRNVYRWLTCALYETISNSFRTATGQWLENVESRLAADKGRG